MAGAEFAELEDLDAVRLTWNVWPHSRLEAAKCVVPFAALYTPARALPALQSVEYDPVPCKACGGVLNPYAAVDFASKLWTCPFCTARNHFPPHYAGASEAAVPAELFPQCSTLEYAPPRPGALSPPAYVFVLDTSVPEDELAACKTAVAQALTLVPEYALVGLVTFGTHVQVHELGSAECPKAYVFRGGKEYTPAAVQAQLGLGGGAGARGPPGAPPGAPGAPGGAAGAAGRRGNRFVLPLSEVEFALTQALEELPRDAFPAPPGSRPPRATGAALAVAAALMAGVLPPGGAAARALLFVGGPCTEGAGKVVDKELAEPIRSHKDLAKGAAPHFARARKHYDALAAALVAAGHALDVYACSLDQVGLAEMKTAVESTGGLAVQADSFANPAFRDSLRRAFSPPEAGGLGLHSNATLEVHCSRDIRVSGALGPAAALERKSPLASDAPVGLGGTTAWKLCSLGPSTTLAVVFDIVAPHAPDGGGAGGQQFFLQFVTRYLHADGRPRVRVTTLTRRWVDGANLADLVQGFDQEAAAVLVARLACHKMETEEDFDATRWLDRSLIRLAGRFGDYRRDDAESFSLRPQLAYLPQFLFHFRRSQFVQVFGNSPDETAYAQMALNREAAGEAMLMLQPTLVAYALGAPGPEPVLLDVTSVAPDRVLLLDAYFYVVIFHGATVAQWRKARYQDAPEHAAFAALLQAPRAEAEATLRRRFPVPRLTDCDQNGSQARFLLAKLNPSSTYNSAAVGGASAAVIMTDDVSLQVFTEHLKKLAVQS